jgi:hypothetical protein
MDHQKPLSRRQFGKKLFLAGGGIAALSLWHPTVNAQMKLPKPTGGDLSESDPTAQALGYYKDAAKVDLKKWPKKAAPEAKNQNCSNCQLYVTYPGTPGKGACVLFANKWVEAKGWCNGYVAKA